MLIVCLFRLGISFRVPDPPGWGVCVYITVSRVTPRREETLGVSRVNAARTALLTGVGRL